MSGTIYSVSSVVKLVTLKSAIIILKENNGNFLIKRDNLLGIDMAEINGGRPQYCQYGLVLINPDKSG